MKRYHSTTLSCKGIALLWIAAAFQLVCARLEGIKTKSAIAAVPASTTTTAIDNHKDKLRLTDDQRNRQHQQQRRTQQCNGQKTFDFYITLDLNPSEIQYTVQCNDGNKYVQSQPFSSSDVYMSFHDHACLPLGYTCVFTISDTSQDGLTAGNGGTFEVWEDGQLINQYGGFQFQVYTVCCGNNCDNYTPPPPCNIVSNIAAQQAAPNPTRAEIEAINKRLHPEFYACRPVTWTLHIDANPRQIWYELRCSDGQGWNRPPGSYSPTQRLTTITENLDCVGPETTCQFAIGDTKKNGLTSEGWYKLTYGDTIVADQRGGQAYTQQGYCFGPECDSIQPIQYNMASTDVTDDGYSEEGPFQSNPTQLDVEDNGGCDQLVQLYLTSDEFAIDIGFKLACDNGVGTRWDKPVGSYTEDDAFSTITQSTCLDSLPTTCCTFTISDSHGDGLISPANNVPGSFELRLGSRSVASYDGSNPNAEYDKLNFFVGSGC